MGTCCRNALDIPGIVRDVRDTGAVFPLFTNDLETIVNREGNIICGCRFDPENQSIRALDRRVRSNDGFLAVTRRHRLSRIA